MGSVDIEVLVAWADQLQPVYIMQVDVSLFLQQVTGFAQSLPHEFERHSHRIRRLLSGGVIERRNNGYRRIGVAIADGLDQTNGR